MGAGESDGYDVEAPKKSGGNGGDGEGWRRREKGGARREKRSMFEIMTQDEILASMPNLRQTISDPKGFRPR